MYETGAQPALVRSMALTDDAQTLVDVVRHHSAARGEERALTFLQDGVNEAGSLTYAALDREARSIAAWLKTENLDGRRALLIFPSGLEFVTAFLGCLYAGVIPVPVNPPRLNRKAHRLRAIVGDAGVAVALTTTRMQDRMRPMLAEAAMGSLRIAPVDARPVNMESRWEPSPLAGHSLAFLQYTSGSTSQPKGVMVSHRNLLANHRMIQQAFGQTKKTRILTWLPLFHDMGLIGNVLQALYLGVECFIIPPEIFLMKPVCWLEAISRHRATFSGAPNFAYELCAQKVTGQQCAHLDLSGWDTAFAGAEPVRHATMERFASAFFSCGFRKTALYPCYGLAEATLFSSGSGKLTGARSVRFDAAALEARQVVECSEQSDHGGRPSRTLVGCGRTWEEQEIVIVDPDSGHRCASGAVGEIWIAGPHVAEGYWNHGKNSEQGFGASLAGMKDRKFLRTGDLGFFHQDSLFICGRIKDLIIIAGRNHDAGDIEETVCACHPAIRPSGCAAFQVEVGEEARLVIAAELERTSRLISGDGAKGGNDRSTFTADEMMKAIREAVSSQHELSIYEIVLLRPATLPKTSSGKIQRHAARTSWMENTLQKWKPKR